MDKLKKLKEHLKSIGYNVDADVITCSSESLSVYMKGEYTGYSTFSLLQYYAENSGKTVKYINDSWDYLDEEE